MRDRPNILFFFTDDQRFDTINALGNRQIHTPNLDRLVSSGTTFTHAHIPGGTCPAVCMPSRAMVHTGRTLFHIDRHGQEVPADQVTMGEWCRQAGYASFGAGKWHNGKSSYARSFSAGDEITFCGMGDHWNVPVYRFDPTGMYETRCPWVPDPSTSNILKYKDCDHITAGKHSTDLFVDAAIHWLRTKNDTHPFFMYVALMAPHDPRTMPERFLKMYDPAQIDLPVNFLPEHPLDTGALRIRDEMLAAFPRDPNEIKRHLAEYYAMITHLDDAFGRVIRALQETNNLENTIIVFSGDNGLALGQHGLMGKQNVYEHSVRVPLILSGPGIPAGVRRDAMVYLLDIFPTLCDLADLGRPASVEGRSFASCLRDSGHRIRDVLYLAYAKSIRGVRTDRYKLIEYACGSSQLFDLAQDPREMHNLAAKPEMAATLAQLRQTMRQCRDVWNDRDHPAGEGFWKARTDLSNEQRQPAKNPGDSHPAQIRA